MPNVAIILVVVKKIKQGMNNNSTNRQIALFLDITLALFEIGGEGTFIWGSRNSTSRLSPQKHTGELAD